MLFTIQNDFAIITIMRRSNIFYLIKDVRYKFYGIEARINGICVFMNMHISHDVRMHYMLHGNIISWAYHKRLKITYDTNWEIECIKKVFKRSSAYVFIKKCNTIGALKELGYSVGPGELIECNTPEEASNIILNK